MSEYPWKDHNWKTRAGIIASFIPPGSRVLDMGGGMEYLLQHLDQPGAYASIDKTRCTDRTIVADFNKGEYPVLDQGFDVVVAQGLVEYLTDPADFLQQAKAYAPMMIVTYLDTASAEAKEKGRVSTFSMHDFRRLLAASGWHLQKKIAYTDNHCIFVCKLPTFHTFVR